jgi:tRNA-dihydrouridine synthase A
MPTRGAVIEALAPYADAHVRAGGRLNNIAKHILGLYHGRPRGRAFRRHIAERASREGAAANVIVDAMHIAEGQAPALAAAE